MAANQNKVGRPIIDINYPASGEFGITELVQLNPQVSRVTLQLKVNQEVQKNALRFSGNRKNGKGRPSKLFIRP